MIMSLVLVLSNVGFAVWAALQWTELKQQNAKLKFRVSELEAKFLSISGVEMLYKGTVNHALERINSLQENINTVQNSMIEQGNRLEARIYDLEGK